MSPPTTQRQSRFLAGLPAEVVAQGGAHECQARDLSRSGVLLVGRLPAVAPESVALTLRSARGDLELQLDGRVVRTDPDDETGEVRWGLVFPPLDAAREALLDALVARVVEGIFPAVLELLGPGADENEIQASLKLVPLAHRIALAQRGGPREREWLAHDGHMSVFEALARNPSTSPPELLRLLRRPELPATMLDALARDRRIARDAELRVALVAHPKLKLETVDLLLPSLDAQDRARALLRPGLRHEVAERLQRASRGGASRR